MKTNPYRILEGETTNRALERLGFRRVYHDPGGELCRRLGSKEVAHHSHRHIERVSDGTVIEHLGCSPPVDAANLWIAQGCPMTREDAAQSDVGHFCRMVRQLSPEGAKGYREAARAICHQSPDFALEVMEVIGNWPSSEPELLALQDVWGTR